MKFRYTAKQGLKKRCEGEIEAANYRLAVEEVLRLGLTPLDVRPLADTMSAPSGSRIKVFFSRITSFKNNIFQMDIVLFSRYLADFLNAGIPVLRALELMQKYFPEGRMRLVLDNLHRDVKSGASLSEAMKQTSGLFSDMYINMVYAGEMSGSLKETVNRLADFMEEDQESRLKVASSLAYPMIILSVACLTLFVLFTWVIPRIMTIFLEMDQTLPFITQVLISISFFFSKFWWIIVLILSAGMMFFVRWYQSEEGRRKTDQWIFSLPWLGNFIREVAVARFARTLGTLLEGGVDIVPALNYAGRVITNQYIYAHMSEVADSVAGGKPLSQAITQTKIFSDADASMLSVGEETGGLSAGLFKLALFYEKRNSRTVKTMTTMVEPALILALGLIIGCVVLAMLMPIFQMNLAVQ